MYALLTYVVVDEVEVVARSDGHGAATSLRHVHVGVEEGLVDEDEGVDDGIAVARRRLQAVEGDRQVRRSNVL